VQDAVGQATGQVQEANGSAGQQVQDAAEQAADGVGNADGADQTKERAVDQTGDIIEITLNEDGEIVGEELVGNVGSLPTEEEYVDGEGRVVRRVRDEAGNRIEQVFDDEGKTVGIRVV
jgi:YD repeat-containing protein